MFLPHNEFWPFWGPAPSSRCPGFTPPEILANFGPIPTFTAVRSTFLAEDPPLSPSPKFWPFLGRPLKDVLEIFQIFGPASSPHTVSIVSCVFLCVFLSCFRLGCVLCLTEDLVRCTLCSVWHGCLYQWSLDSLRLHKTLNTEQSRKQRKHRRKPR